jgi:hypothetical protein
MRVLLGSMSLVLFLTVSSAGAQSRSVRIFVPNPCPTSGPQVEAPFFGFQETRYLMILDRDRLPTREVVLTALHLIPTGPGVLAARNFRITIGEAPSRFPDPEFDKNLNRAQLVYEEPHLNLKRTGDFFTFKFRWPYAYEGGKHLAVEIRYTGLGLGVKSRGASSRVRAIYASGKGAYNAKRGTGSGPGMKTGLDAMTSLPTITSSGSCQPGTDIDLSFNSSRIGDAYLAGCAFTTSPGIDIGEYTIPLNPDGLFYSVWWLPTIFEGFEGKIENYGTGRGRIKIPKEPKLIGVSFAIAFVTLGKTNKISSVSMEHWVTIGMGCGG